MESRLNFVVKYGRKLSVTDSAYRRNFLMFLSDVKDLTKKSLRQRIASVSEVVGELQVTQMEQDLPRTFPQYAFFCRCFVVPVQLIANENTSFLTYVGMALFTRNCEASCLLGWRTAPTSAMLETAALADEGAGAGRVVPRRHGAVVRRRCDDVVCDTSKSSPSSAYV